MEGVFKVISGIVTVLILVAVFALMIGHKPKPCPPHICYPKDRIVTAEQYLAANPSKPRTTPPTT